MKKLSKIIGIITLLVICKLSFGQLSTNEKPISFLQKDIKWKSSEFVSLPKLDMERIHQEDIKDEEYGTPPRFGYPHAVNLNLENSGEWIILPNGDKLWKLEIYCPSAKSINLLYDKFWLPDGAKLFVYSKDKKHSIGAFTAQNNKGSKKELRGFATGLIYSNNIVVEYYESKEIKEKGIVSIAYVVHGYRYINVFESEKSFGSSGSCQVNVNCIEGQNWQKEKNAVAMILVD